MGIEVGNKERQSPKFRLFEPRRYKRAEANSASSHVFDSQSSRRKISLLVRSEPPSGSLGNASLVLQRRVKYFAMRNAKRGGYVLSRSGLEAASGVEKKLRSIDSKPGSKKVIH